MVSNGSSQDERLLWFLGQPKSLCLLSHIEESGTNRRPSEWTDRKAAFYSLSEQEIHKGSAINTGTYNEKLKLDLSISNIGMHSPSLIRKGNNLQKVKI